VRHSIAVSPVAWLLCLPYAVEILGQTRLDPHTRTEVSATAIYGNDWETRRNAGVTAGRVVGRVGLEPTTY